MEAKTQEMVDPSRHAEMSVQLDALRQARDQLRVECNELQIRTNDNLSEAESRRCIYMFRKFVVVLIFVEKLQRWYTPRMVPGIGTIYRGHIVSCRSIIRGDQISI